MRQKLNLVNYRTIQWVVISLIVSLSGGWGGLKMATAAFGGCLIYFISILVFEKVVFKYQGAQNANKIVGGFYKGAFLKFLITILLFLPVMISLPQHGLNVVIAFSIITILMGFLNFLVPFSRAI